MTDMQTNMKYRQTKCYKTAHLFFLGKNNSTLFPT